MTQIVFLGTGTTPSVIARQLRASGGFILKEGGLQFHIDPGPGALNLAKQCNINPRANTAIIVTHAHLAHCHDVNALISSMTLNGLDKQGVLIANKTFIEGHEDHHSPLDPHYHKFLERTITLNPGQKVGIENIEIRAIQAQHLDPHTLALKFILPQLTLAYTSDTTYSRELVDGLKRSDILILNVVEPGDKKSKINLNTNEAIKIIKKIQPNLAIIQHFGYDMLKEDPLLEARKITNATNTQVIAATDCLSLTPSSYAAKSKQKRLNTFKNKNQP